MVIFNSYVKLPEGNHHCNLRPLLLSMSPWPQSQGIFLSHFVDDLKFRPLKKKTIEGDHSPIFIRENKPNVSNHQHCYVSFFAIIALLGFLMTIPLELNDLLYRPAFICRWRAPFSKNLLPHDPVLVFDAATLTFDPPLKVS